MPPARLLTSPRLPLDSVTEEQSCPGEQGTEERGEDTLFPSLLFFPLCYAVPVNLGLVRCAASFIYGTRGIRSYSWQRLDLAAPWQLAWGWSWPWGWQEGLDPAQAPTGLGGITPTVLGGITLTGLGGSHPQC